MSDTSETTDRQFGMCLFKKKKIFKKDPDIVILFFVFVDHRKVYTKI